MIVKSVKQQACFILVAIIIGFICTCTPPLVLNTAFNLVPYVCYYYWVWPTSNHACIGVSGTKHVAIMMFHGLASRPSDWFQVHNELALRASAKGGYVFHTYTPYIYAHGDAPLQEVMHHMTDGIAMFLQASSDMPVCVLGSSNGARIALMARLLHRDRPMFVGLAAGPLHGTLVADWFALSGTECVVALSSSGANG